MSESSIKNSTEKKKSMGTERRKEGRVGRVRGKKKDLLLSKRVEQKVGGRGCPTREGRRVRTKRIAATAAPGGQIKKIIDEERTGETYKKTGKLLERGPVLKIQIQLAYSNGK